jgi:DNA-binding beta-propeller fold protein YncE
MIKRLQRLPQGPRIVIFVFMVVGALLLLGGVTFFLITATLNSSPRQTGQGLLETVTVAQLAALPDNDAYPSTVAAGSDSTVYTASFATGAVWAISPDGATVTEIPNTRDRFDGVTALAVRADNTLLAVAFTANGENGVWAIYAVTATGEITEFGRVTDAQGFVSPFDITLDRDGGVYVVDRSRADIWRWEPSGGAGELWWSMLTPPDNAAEGNVERPAPTGIAYDALTDSLLVTDPDANTVIRIMRDRSGSQIVFRSADERFPPGLDGIAVAPDGTIYVTALDQKGVARIAPESTELAYIAGNFRGPSDLAILPDGRLVVANFDSAALVQPGIQPQLPFALDVIEFEG